MFETLMPGVHNPGMEAFWSVITVTVVFLIYHFAFYKPGAENPGNHDPEVSNSGQIMKQRMMGVILFGIVPFAVALLLFRFPVQGYGINFLNLGFSMLWAALLSPILLLINYLNASKPANLRMYPQIRRKLWSYSNLASSALSWISYLIAYEFMFRGFLLFSFYHSFGPEIAIAVNTSIYALVHLPKGKKETLGAIPLGIILCILTLYTWNIWFAVVVHIILALSNEWMSISAHPHMKIIKSK